MTKSPDTQFSPSTITDKEPGISLTTLILASSVSLGSNLLEVQRGRMEPKTAVANAVIKGTLSSAVIAGIRPTTPLRTAGCLCLLGSVGYIVDSLMKNNSTQSV